MRKLGSDRYRVGAANSWLSCAPSGTMLLASGDGFCVLSFDGRALHRNPSSRKVVWFDEHSVLVGGTPPRLLSIPSGEELADANSVLRFIEGTTVVKGPGRQFVFVRRKQDFSTVQLLDFATRSVRGPVFRVPGWLRSVCFLGDGAHLAVASGEEPVQIFHTGTGTLVATLSKETLKTQAIASTPHERRFATVVEASEVLLWEEGQFARPAARLRSSASLYGDVSLAFSPDGRALACAVRFAGVSVWTIDPKRERFFAKESLTGSDVCWLSDSRLAVLREETIAFLDANEGTFDSFPEGPASSVDRMLLSDPAVFSLAKDGTLARWDLRSGHCSLVQRGERTKSIALSPEHGSIVTIDEQKLVFRSAHTLETQRQLRLGVGHFDTALAWLPNSHELLAGGERDLTVFDSAESVKHSLRLDGAIKRIEALSAALALVLIEEQQGCRLLLFDTRDGSTKTIASKVRDCLAADALLGLYAFAEIDGPVRVFREDGSELCAFETRQPISMTFAPGCTHLAVARYAHDRVELWSLPTPETKPFQSEVFDSAVTAVCYWGPRTLVVGTALGQVVIVDLVPEKAGVSHAVLEPSLASAWHSFLMRMVSADMSSYRGHIARELTSDGLALQWTQDDFALRLYAEPAAGTRVRFFLYVELLSKSIHGESVWSKVQAWISSVWSSREKIDPATVGLTPDANFSLELLRDGTAYILTTVLRPEDFPTRAQLQRWIAYVCARVQALTKSA